MLPSLKDSALRGLMRRFALGGVVNTAAGLAVLFGLRNALHCSEYVANAGGYLAGLACGYLLHRDYAFRDVELRRVTGPRYVAAFLIAYGVNVVVLAIGLSRLGLPGTIAQLCAIASHTVVFFLLCRWVVFTRPASSTT